MKVGRTSDHDQHQLNQVLGVEDKDDRDGCQRAEEPECFGEGHLTAQQLFD